MAFRGSGPGHGLPRVRPGSWPSTGQARVMAFRGSGSIHAYSPPLTSMRRFDVAASGLLRAIAEQRSW